MAIALNDIAYTTPRRRADTLALKIIASPTLAEIQASAYLEVAPPAPYADLTAFGVVNIPDVRLDLPLRATAPVPLTTPGFVNPYGVATAGSGAADPGSVGYRPGSVLLTSNQGARGALNPAALR